MTFNYHETTTEEKKAYLRLNGWIERFDPGFVDWWVDPVEKDTIQPIDEALFIQMYRDGLPDPWDD